MFPVYWCDNDGPQRVMGFVLHSQTKLFRYTNLFIHINGMILGAPRLFYQDCIVLGINQAYCLHISAVLSNDKNN